MAGSVIGMWASVGIAVAFPCVSPIDFIGIRAVREGNTFVMRWSAESDKTRLVWSPTPHISDSWQPVGTQAADGLPAAWRGTFEMVPPKAFFKLVSDAPPQAAPTGFRVVRLDGRLQLEWGSTFDAAGYVVFVESMTQGGSAEGLRRIMVPVGNSLEIDGLESGKQYRLSIAAMNFAGEGPACAPVTARFGPQVLVCGDVVVFHSTAQGRSFRVEAAGATVMLEPLQPVGGGAFMANANASGHFRIPRVPPGMYWVRCLWQGEFELLPEALVVGEGGAAISPIEIGVTNEGDGDAVFGALTLADGSPAHCALPEFDIDEKSTLTARFADGGSRVVTSDSRGRWSLGGVRQAAYPVEIEANYAGRSMQHVLASPAADPVILRFDEQVPDEVRVRAFQNGREVRDILPGVPVTFSAEVGKGANSAEPIRWVSELNGVKATATGAQWTQTFEHPEGPQMSSMGGLGDPQDTGMITLRLVPSLLDGSKIRLFKFHLIDWSKILGCWSGTVTAWNPYAPTSTSAAHPASVRLDHSGTLPVSPLFEFTSVTAGGYFEMGVDPVNRAPYVLRIDKDDHMRFLWPYEFQLPKEGQFSLVPADIYSVSQGPSGVVINHPSGGSVHFPPGSLLDPSNVAWTGNIVVRMVSFDPRLTSPLPPNPILHSGANRRGIAPYGAFWLDVQTDGGVPLTPTSAAKIRVYSSFTPSNPSTMSAYHQNEATGYFETWTPASLVSTRTYELNLGGGGLFLIGNDQALIELVFEADRSLNYPFDVLIGGWNANASVASDGYSLHTVTVQGPCRNSYGKLYVAHNSALRIGVIDLRHGPGRHHATISPASAVVDPINKPLVIRKVMVPSTTPATPPAVAGHWVKLSLADTESSLKSNPADTTVTAITSANHFLSRGGVSSAADAAQYYAKINAPTTLSAWRAANGLPSRFGDPMPGVPANEYATAYYYNLGDLGFARAQTMRVRESGYDCKPDVAFAVTNYETLEDARCGRGPVATVCMDYSARVDQGEMVAKRYTRFYVYGSNGQILHEANLDGAGLKGVPNLCVTCHGGDFYSAGGSTNLGSKFLPFDLESYSFHPGFGIQHTELAKMNAAVRETMPTAAIADLIKGWYGTSDPMTNPLAFNQGHVPTQPLLSWTPDTNLYSNMFKQSCRICHISRNGDVSMQFNSYSAFQNYGFGKYSANISLQMPHAQRTWGGYWGSRCSNLLGFPVSDMPTVLDNAGP